MTEVIVAVGQVQDQEQVLIETELGVISVEYDHFVKDCLTTREEREIKYSRCSI